MVSAQERGLAGKREGFYRRGRICTGGPLYRIPDLEASCAVPPPSASPDVPGMRRPGLIRQHAAVACSMALVVAVTAGCGGDGGPARSGPTEVSTTSPETASPETAQAEQLATAFLTALVEASHDTAYALLTDSARATVTAEEFAAARERKAGSARGLAIYEIVGVEVAGDTLTVEATGRLTDGTPTRIALPLSPTPEGLRVNAVPAAY